jgi:hypothetical protein
MKAFIFNKQTKENFKLEVNQEEVKCIQLLKNPQLYFSHKLY